MYLLQLRGFAERFGSQTNIYAPGRAKGKSEPTIQLLTQHSLSPSGSHCLPTQPPYGFHVHFALLLLLPASRCRGCERQPRRVRAGPRCPPSPCPPPSLGTHRPRLPGDLGRLAPTDRRTDRQTETRTDGQTDGQTDGGTARPRRVPAAPPRSGQSRAPSTPRPGSLPSDSACAE